MEQETPHTHEIHYSVNDEPQTTTSTELPPVQIMSNAGIDPNNNYLVQIEGNHRTSYKDDPNTPIHMHNEMNFITNFMGPKQVSC